MGCAVRAALALAPRTRSPEARPSRRAAARAHAPRRRSHHATETDSSEQTPACSNHHHTRRWRKRARWLRRARYTGGVGAWRCRVSRARATDNQPAGPAGLIAIPAGAPRCSGIKCDDEFHRRACLTRKRLEDCVPIGDRRMAEMVRAAIRSIERLSHGRRSPLAQNGLGEISYRWHHLRPKTIRRDET